MKLRLAFIFACLASPSIADYSGHEAVTLFSERPCGDVVSAIDGASNPFPDDGLDDFEAILVGMANQGMVWGFLLGFDTAEGGLHGDAETTLERLHAACEATPEATAESLLRGFVE